MKFEEYEYLRPDFDSYQTHFSALVAELETAASFTAAKEAVEKINKIRRQLDTAANLASIRYSIDTNDAYYEKESEFWDEYAPHFDSLDVKYYQAIMDSAYLEELKTIFPQTFFLFAENRLRLFDDAVIPLLQKENQLTTSYSKLVASAQIDFEGKTYTLAQLKPFTEAKERAVRKASAEKYYGFFAANEARFDDIYDQMVKVRTEIAQTLGFKNYVEYADVKMNRWDYDRKMIQTYRKEILEKVVPATQKLYQRQAKRNGLTTLAHYDLPLVYPSGNATPKGTAAELVEKARQMYHELSFETGEFFDFMTEHHLLDLLSKTDKQSGGYCTFIADYKAPFIFANFNGTSGDVDVLTHEAGHAFQCYQSQWITEPELIFPNYESAEIHSMSMEFIAWPWMDRFFKDETAKYQFAHLSSGLQFLPYGVSVDHFQQEVYENPDWTPAERKACWRRLEKQYNPEKNYADSAALDRGIYWFRQGHIFEAPFYYIDYTLAQVCAFQFFKRVLIDHDEKAWQDYLAICKVGGTQTFLEILATGHLTSPFVPGALDETIAAVEAYLDSIDETVLA